MIVRLTDEMLDAVEKALLARSATHPHLAARNRDLADSLRALRDRAAAVHKDATRPILDGACDEDVEIATELIDSLSEVLP